MICQMQQPEGIWSPGKNEMNTMSEFFSLKTALVILGFYIKCMCKSNFYENNNL